MLVPKNEVPGCVPTCGGHYYASLYVGCIVYRSHGSHVSCLAIIARVTIAYTCEMLASHTVQTAHALIMHMSEGLDRDDDDIDDTYESLLL